MEIKVLGISNRVTKVGANNSTWEAFDLSYEANGNVNTRKIVSFRDEFNILSNASEGDHFNVIAKKNGRFYDWTVTPISTNEALAFAPTDPVHNKAPAKERTSSYETAEERASRQELIVRQSSLSNAIAFESPAEFVDEQEREMRIERVLETALRFRNFIYQVQGLEKQPFPSFGNEDAE